MGTVINIGSRPRTLSCSKCGSLLWNVVMEADTVAQIVCPSCDTVYDFTEEGIEIVFE